MLTNYQPRVLPLDFIVRALKRESEALDHYVRYGADEDDHVDDACANDLRSWIDQLRHWHAANPTP